MNVRQLRALHALMASGTVTSVARTLGVTQPAVSRMLLQLETDVGFPLFRRHRGRLLATPEGKRFHQEASKVLSNFDRLTTISRDIKKLQSGYLRVVAMQTFAYTVLPLAIAHFVRAHPGVTLEIKVRQRSEIAEIIAAEEFDVAFTLMPDFGGNITVERLMSARAVCIMPLGHPLANRASIDAADLTEQTLVTGAENNWFRTEIYELFSAASVRPPHLITAETATMVCELVAAGLGLAVVHPYIAQRFSDRLIARPLAHEINLGFFVVFPEHGAQELLPRHLIDSVRFGVNHFCQSDDEGSHRPDV